MVKQDATGRDPRRAKLDIVYGTDPATPHTKWADPYVKGPLRAFIISSVHEGRVVSELMQRLSLEVRAVSVDPRWDVNRWSIDRYPAFGDRLPKDYAPSYDALVPELTAKTDYDVIVMHSMRGWNDLPAAGRAAILRRVKAGTGLVFVHPHLGEEESDQSLWDLLPLTNVTPTKMTLAGAGIDSGYPEPPKQAMSGAPWKTAAQHYVTAGLPLEALPYPALQHYRYQLGKGAQALITGVDGRPVVAVKPLGKGRVVGLGYHAHALFPELQATPGELEENFWECLYSLLMRSIIWAAGKEPQVTVQAVSPSARRFTPDTAGAGLVTVRLANAGAAAQVKLAVIVRDERRAVEAETEVSTRLAPGEEAVQVPLPAGRAAGGRHFVEVIVSTGGKKSDWGAATYEVTREARVGTVKLAAEAVAAGGRLAGTAQVKGSGAGLALRAELWDGLGRLLAVQSTPVGRKRLVPFRLTCPEALTHVGWVKCQLVDDARVVDEGRARVVLTAPRRTWQDYEVILPWLHEGLSPWTELVEAQYRRAGITSSSAVDCNFPLTVSMDTPGFGVYWWKRQSYVANKQAYGKSKDTRLLVRDPCFHTDGFRRPVAKALRKGIPPLLKFSPLAYFIADESSVTAYEDAFDLCWAPETLAAFRVWLRKRYPTLAALNAEWGTRYRSWDKVQPVTGEEARQRGNPAPWVDHRLFMNRTLVTGFAYARDVAQKIDPEGMVTVSGTQSPSSHNGCDWWQMDQIIQYLQPYSGGGQDEMHRSFNPHLLLTGFTGYSQSGSALEYEIWHRFLHGHRGASIFWGYSLLDPDLSLNAQGRSFEKVFGELRGEGLSRLVQGLERPHDKIALHFSMASGHVWWIQDGQAKYDDIAGSTSTSANFRRFLHNREAWGTLLEDAGYQYNYVSYEQVENGDFAKAGYRVLILPGSIALSTREVEQIRAFVRKGGTVIADVMPGLTTVHGKPLAQSSLADLFATPKYGRGRARCAGRWAEEYAEARTEALGRQARELLCSELQASGVRPRVQVAAAGGTPPVGVERVSWTAGELEVVALLKEMRGVYVESSDGTMRYEGRSGMPAAERLRVRAAHAAHWYDLRTHAYLGEMSEVRTSLHEADPKLFALLPYRVKGLKLAREGGGARGEVVRYAVSLNIGHAKAARHVAKLEVFAPDGRRQTAYSTNVTLRNGQGKGQFRLALNDAVGAWRMVATDIISGEKAEASWRVR